MTTAKKSQRAASFVLLSLIAALIAGLVLYAVYAGRSETAVALLIGCVIVAFLLVIVTARITVGVRRSRRLAETHNVPPSGFLHLLDLRQWLILLVGVTVISIGTGALTGVRVLAGEDPAESSPPQAVAPPATTPTIDVPTPTTEVSATETPGTEPSATDLAIPTETVEPAGAEESPVATPAPGSTKYLDSEEALDGYYDPRAVNLSANRYPRGISFYCNTATSTNLQWNVAGSTRFAATAGIDDNTENAFGVVAELLFYDQDGRPLLPKPVEVSVGHPKKVQLDLKGVVSLRMTCAGREAKTNEKEDTYVVLGDPIVVLS